MVDADPEDLLDSLGPPARRYVHVDGVSELQVRVGTGMSAREMRAVGRAKHWMNQDARWRQRYVAGFFRSHQRDNFVDEKVHVPEGEPAPYACRHNVPGLAQHDARVAGQRSLFRERYHLMQQMAVRAEAFESQENEEMHDVPAECADPRTSAIARATWDTFAQARDENLAHRRRAAAAARVGGTVMSEAAHAADPQLPLAGDRLVFHLQTESDADDLRALLLDPDQEAPPQPARFVQGAVDVLAWGEGGPDPAKVDAKSVDGLGEVVPRGLMDFARHEDRQALGEGRGSLSPSKGFRNELGKPKPASCFTQYGARVYARDNVPKVKAASKDDFTDRWSEFWLPLLLDTDAESLREFTTRERREVEGSGGEYVWGDPEDAFVERMHHIEARRKRGGREDMSEPGVLRQAMHNNAPEGTFGAGVGDRV